MNNSKPFWSLFHHQPLKLEPKVRSFTALASANIALVKYWGKRDRVLNLPLTSSLSLSLGDLGTQFKLSVDPSLPQDHYELNEKILAPTSHSYRRLFEFLSPFRPQAMAFRVVSNNTVATAAGLASSASAFASASKALNGLFEWDLPLPSLSRLARLGSGSACRSIQRGWVTWERGNQEDGLDSYGKRFAEESAWPDLTWIVVTIDGGKKKIASRQAMKATLKTSPLMSSWPKVVEQDLYQVKRAFEERNFTLLGETLEANALCMHSMMLAARPSICYFQGASIDFLQWIWDLRKEGAKVYATLDAGPNIKLLIQKRDVDSFISMLKEYSKKQKREIFYQVVRLK